MASSAIALARIERLFATACSFAFSLFFFSCGDVDCDMWRWDSELGCFLSFRGVV